MNTHRLIPCLATVLAASLACEKPAPPPAPPPPAPKEAAAPEPTPPEPEPRSAYVTMVVSVRKLATEDSKVEIEGETVANWVATLHRGEQLDVVGTEGEWSRVRLEGDLEGWVPARWLLEAEGVTPVTVADEVGTFDRPDLIAVNAKRKVDAGTLLFRLRESGDFAEVNAGGNTTTWVRSSDLLSGEDDVAVALFLGKARWLMHRKGGEGVEALQEVVAAQFGASRLAPLMLTVIAPPEDLVPDAD